MHSETPGSMHRPHQIAQDKLPLCWKKNARNSGRKRNAACVPCFQCLGRRPLPFTHASMIFNPSSPLPIHRFGELPAVPDIVKDPQRLLNARQCLGSEVLEPDLKQGTCKSPASYRPSPVMLCNSSTFELDKQPAYKLVFLPRCSSDDDASFSLWSQRLRNISMSWFFLARRGVDRETRCHPNSGRRATQRRGMGAEQTLIGKCFRSTN